MYLQTLKREINNALQNSRWVYEGKFEVLINKRTTGFNDHLSIRYNTLTSCQKGSYLYINSPIIE